VLGFNKFLIHIKIFFLEMKGETLMKQLFIIFGAVTQYELNIFVEFS